MKLSDEQFKKEVDFAKKESEKMGIKTLELRIKYRDLSIEQIEDLLFNFMGTTQGKVFSITKVENLE